MTTTRAPWIPSAGFALLWVIVALVTEDTTFHLAPPIVAAAMPVAARSTDARWPLLGFAVAAAVTAGLAVAGFMEGPSLLPWGGAVTESLIGAAVGGVAGWVLAAPAASDR